MSCVELGRCRGLCEMLGLLDFGFGGLGELRDIVVTEALESL